MCVFLQVASVEVGVEEGEEGALVEAEEVEEEALEEAGVEDSEEEEEVVEEVAASEVSGRHHRETPPIRS